MSRKEWVLVALVLVLGGWYAVFFSGWFRPKAIRVEHTVRSLRDAWGSEGRVDLTGKQINNVTFSLHKDYRLTSVKVVLAAEFQTNHYAHPLWHLVSPTGSAPVRGFSYGTPVPGMLAAAANAEPEPLEPGVKYRLVVEASSIRGEHDFLIPASTSRRR